ncbi:MAG: lipoprotein-releasing system transmembrane subunit LolC [Pelagibacteraceae bacterium TMED287]|nr:MAG: lipoprotein-releasing system transmembrane subunit LolC [Pelagibacteraceae bacterium TMED287]
MFNKAERLISFRNLKPKKKEGFLKVISVFSFLGIMIGVAILIIVMSVMNGFRADLTEKILGLNPHIVVSSNGYFIDEEFKSNLKRKFKNFNFAKSYGNEGIILAKDYTKGILIKGIDSKNLDNFIFLKKKLAKGNIKNFKIGSALIGRELAYNLNLKIGDDISLMSSTFVKTPLGGFPLQEKFKIAGIFNSGFFEYDQNVVFLDLEDSLSLFDKTNKDINLEIYIDKPIEADIYKKEISQINENFYVYSWTDINKSFFSALKVERNVMFIILTLIIIVAAFNIISGLTILIKNKTREIAILKTLGLSNKSIKKSFFLTGLTIGFFASISGVILGSVFSIYIEEIRIFLSQVFDLNIFPSDVYFLDELPSELNLKSTLLIFIFSLLITAIASYFPASSISKMETIKGLKYD